MEKYILKSVRTSLDYGRERPGGGGGGNFHRGGGTHVRILH